MSDFFAVSKPVRMFAPGNYDPEKVSELYVWSYDFDNDPDMCQQQFKEEADINTIVKRFGLTGELPENVVLPRSGDFTGITDYHSAMNALIAADKAFMELPANVRAEFENDPQRLMDFMADDANLDRARELGLVNKAPEVTRDVVQAVDELKAVLTPKS